MHMVVYTRPSKKKKKIVDYLSILHAQILQSMLLLSSQDLGIPRESTWLLVAERLDASLI